MHNSIGCNTRDLDSRRPASALVTIAGSAGALLVLKDLLESFAAPLPAAIAVMLHSGRNSRLTATLGQWSQLPVRLAVSGDLLQDEYVYVAGTQTHLIVNPDARLTVSQAPRVRSFRPSADWLFESAAATFRDRHVAVILSGMLSDGAQRLRMVKHAGATILVQSPADAAFAQMPSAAIKTGVVDQVVSRSELATAIVNAVHRSVQQGDFLAWDNPFANN